ncbi:hypothetical protein [Agrobacterium sp. CG674]
MTASHPTFASGHCFMVETLNKPEVEFLGELLHRRLACMRATVPARVEPSEYRIEVKRINAILKKMDHPLFEE